MIQGEPLELPADGKSDATDAAIAGPAPQSPQIDRSSMTVDIAEHLSKTIETVGADGGSGGDTLDTEVQNLLNALADEEFGHDEAWVEVSQTVDSVEGDALPDDIHDPLPYPGTAPVAASAGEPMAVPTGMPFAADSAEPEPDGPDGSHGIADRSTDDDFAADTASGIVPESAPEIASGSVPETPTASGIETASGIGEDRLADKREETDTLIGAAPSDTPALSGEKARDDGALDRPLDPAARAMPGVAQQVTPQVAQQATPQTTPEPARSADPSAESLSLKAIEMLGGKIAASEERYDGALNKMGHALGMIAQRIDSLEARMTDQTIANVALAAAPPEIEDPSVAPYIARAERELKARKESGSMDIFDRIAQAAENEFDDRPDRGGAQVLANATDGRRVGTKKWQPSKTVKRRMEQLEKSRAGAPDDAAPRPAAPPLQADAHPGPALDPEDFAAQADAAQATPEPVFDPEEEDDSGLSVLPGARGRRRNRARKSRLDEDFENVFVEDGDKPSIQSLRRKMRERPVDEPGTEEPEKTGMLGGLLGRKSARKAAPAMPDPASLDDVHDNEEDLLAAFDDPGEEVLKAPKRSKNNKHVDIEDEDDEYDADEDAWHDEDAGTGSKRKPLIYALIVAAAGAGVFAWKTFLG